MSSGGGELSSMWSFKGPGTFHHLSLGSSRTISSSEFSLWMGKGCWEKRKKVEKAHQSQAHITFLAGPLSKTHHMATSVTRCKGAGQGYLATCLGR